MKKFYRILSTIICISFCALSLCCSQPKVMTFTAFNSPVRIEARNKGLTTQVQNQITQIFQDLETTFDNDNLLSDTYKINNAKVGEKITLSQSTIEVLTLSKDLYQFTDKKFNPASLPLSRLWKFENYPVLNFTPPTSLEINTLLGNATDFDGISLLNQECSKSLEIELDFGGIVKGFAVDKSLEILRSNGYTQGYINVGSSSLAILHVDSLGVRHPRATEQTPTLLSVDLSSKQFVTISTSGDYERYYEYQGQRYCHIIDSTNGYPVNTGVQSATIIGCTGAISDALTTALCAYSHTPLDLENSPLVNFMKKIISTYDAYDLFVAFENYGVKQLITNKEQGKDFTLFDTTYQVVKI